MNNSGRVVHLLHCTTTGRAAGEHSPRGNSTPHPVPGPHVSAPCFRTPLLWMFYVAGVLACVLLGLASLTENHAFHAHLRCCGSLLCGVCRSFHIYDIILCN